MFKSGKLSLTSQRTQSSPTCYTFPAPPQRSTGTAAIPVAASLFTCSASSEPGMILVGAEGEVRFWDHLSLALSNVDRFHTVDLKLNDTDFADHLHSINVTTSFQTDQATADTRTRRSS